MKNKTNEREYKGQPVLDLIQDGHNTPLISFGLEKAKLILARQNEIKAFVAKFDKTK
jgi:hypothetical protein